MGNSAAAVISPQTSSATSTQYSANNRTANGARNILNSNVQQFAKALTKVGQNSSEFSISNAKPQGPTLIADAGCSAVDDPSQPLPAGSDAGCSANPEAGCSTKPEGACSANQEAGCSTKPEGACSASPEAGCSAPAPASSSTTTVTGIGDHTKGKKWATTYGYVRDQVTQSADKLGLTGSERTQYIQAMTHKMAQATIAMNSYDPTRMNGTEKVKTFTVDYIASMGKDPSKVNISQAAQDRFDGYHTFKIGGKTLAWSEVGAAQRSARNNDRVAVGSGTALDPATIFQSQATASAVRPEAGRNVERPSGPEAGCSPTPPNVNPVAQASPAAPGGLPAGLTAAQRDEWIGWLNRLNDASGSIGDNEAQERLTQLVGGQYPEEVVKYLGNYYQSQGDGFHIQRKDTSLKQLNPQYAGQDRPVVAFGFSRPSDTDPGKLATRAIYLLQDSQGVVDPKKSRATNPNIEDRVYAMFEEVNAFTKARNGQHVETDAQVRHVILSWKDRSEAVLADFERKYIQLGGKVTVMPAKNNQGQDVNIWTFTPPPKKIQEGHIERTITIRAIERAAPPTQARPPADEPVLADSGLTRIA